MRRSVAAVVFLSSAALVFAASGASAGALLSAQLLIEVNGLTPAVFTASGPFGGSAHGTGAGATWSVALGDVPTGSTVVPTTTNQAPIEELQWIVNGNLGTGAFAASSAGDMGVTGVMRARNSSHLTLVSIPLHFGEPFVVTPPVVLGQGITTYANAWTTKTTTLVPTPSAFVTRMGSNGLAGGGGTVVLVTALNVVTNLALPFPIFATLTLSYAPDAVSEPGTLLLLGTGAAGLVGIGRRKLRR